MMPYRRSVLSKSPALDATESDWHAVSEMPASTQSSSFRYNIFIQVRVMLQQGEYELHRGQHDRALAYLDKAVKVKEGSQPITFKLRGFKCFCC